MTSYGGAARVETSGPESSENVTARNGRTTATRDPLRGEGVSSLPDQRSQRQEAQDAHDGRAEERPSLVVDGRGRQSRQEVRVAERREPAAIGTDDLGGDECRHDRDGHERQPALDRPGDAYARQHGDGQHAQHVRHQSHAEDGGPYVGGAHRNIAAPMVAAATAPPMRHQVPGRTSDSASARTAATTPMTT